MIFGLDSIKSLYFEIKQLNNFEYHILNPHLDFKGKRQVGITDHDQHPSTDHETVPKRLLALEMQSKVF